MQNAVIDFHYKLDIVDGKQVVKNKAGYTTAELANEARTLIENWDGRFTEIAFCPLCTCYHLVHH